MIDSSSRQPFEARDIERLLGIDRNRLFFWTRTLGLVVPEVAEAQGTGRRARFSVRNLLELATIKEMFDFGLDLRTIKRVKQHLDVPTRTFSGKTVFEQALIDEDKEKLFLRIRRDRRGRMAGEVEYINPCGDYDVDGDALSATPIPTEERESLFRERGFRPDFRLFVQLEIGALAKEIIDKLGT